MLAAWQKVGQEVVSHEARYALFSSVFLYSSLSQEDGELDFPHVHWWNFND